MRSGAWYLCLSPHQPRSTTTGFVHNTTGESSLLRALDSGALEPVWRLGDYLVGHRMLHLSPESAVGSPIDHSSPSSRPRIRRLAWRESDRRCAASPSHGDRDLVERCFRGSPRRHHRCRHRRISDRPHSAQTGLRLLRLRTSIGPGWCLG